MRKTFVPACAAVALLALVGCGSGDHDSDPIPVGSAQSSSASSSSASGGDSASAAAGGTTSSSAPASPAPTSVVTQTVTATPSATPSSTKSAEAGSGSGGTKKECSGISGQAQAEQNLSKLPDAKVGEWTAEYADTENYDDCAGLSAVQIFIKGATGGSPHQIMLFHHGKYLGTATAKSYGNVHIIKRLDDNTLRVTYRWPDENHPTAMPNLSATATFTYDDAQGKVVMTGHTPPEDQGV